MKTRILQISSALLLCGSSAVLAQTPAPPPKLPQQGRIELFVGYGSAAWLPQSTALPTAREIDNRAQKLGARQRNIGPFGLRMFPVEEQAASTQSTIARAADRVTLNQALQTLRLNGINLAHKEFLIGARNVFVGDSLELAFKGEVFIAEVVEVGPTQIVFKDNARKETGVMSHHLVQQFALEPLQDNRRKAALREMLTPMEPQNIPRP